MKPNYQFAKRQRDLAKKQRKEEKRKRKSESDNPPSVEGDAQQPPADKDSTTGQPV